MLCSVPQFPLLQSRAEIYSVRAEKSAQTVLMESDGVCSTRRKINPWEEKVAFRMEFQVFIKAEPKKPLLEKAKRKDFHFSS